MEQQYPSRLLERCVSEFAKLPGIGRRTALRLVLKLLKQKPEEAHALAESLTALVDNVKYCSVCHNISDTDVCDICANPLRDHSTICVVENVRSVLSIEQTGAFRGLYHVLGGIISPMDGVGPSQLEIDPLVERVATGDVKEVIFALSPTMEGDTTNFYISRRLEGMPVRLTTLARGLSVGDDLEYADEVTLGRSIRARVDLKSKA
ncbi:MAG: recombination mediator RecR [Alloprevotella sp.]|nr:recombination mediator RecR [Alloprevotella sp.]